MKTEMDVMNMDERQRDMLSILRRGQAAVFVEGDDRPIMVSVPYAKIEVPTDMRTKAGSDARGIVSPGGGCSGGGAAAGLA